MRDKLQEYIKKLELQQQEYNKSIKVTRGDNQLHHTVMSSKLAGIIYDLKELLK